MNIMMTASARTIRREGGAQKALTNEILRETERALFSLVKSQQSRVKTQNATKGYMCVSCMIVMGIRNIICMVLKTGNSSPYMVSVFRPG